MSAVLVYESVRASQSHTNLIISTLADIVFYANNRAESNPKLQPSILKIAKEEQFFTVTTISTHMILLVRFLNFLDILIEWMF